MRFSRRHQGRLRTLAGVAAAGVTAVCGVTIPVALAAPATAAPTTSNSSPSNVKITPEGLKAGAIKHVWLIILENKSYDATFTGLNKNTYLWKTLPEQGLLLKDYYGTGHYSMDNYLSMVSGQGPSAGPQNDCSEQATVMGPNSNVITTGTPTSGKGQLLAEDGPNPALGDNGCAFPTEVPNLFNQLNAAGKSWKGYAQDLGGAQPTGATSYQSDTVPGRDDGTCGYPGTAANDPVANPTNLTQPSGNVVSYTGAQAAQPSKGLPADQYVAKHFPFPWFTSLTGEKAGTVDGVSYPASAPLNVPASGSNCDATHIANLDNPTDGLVHDLQKASTTPAFSWITPDNCSDAHDATCQGNNLSGAFTRSGQPDYHPAGLPAFDPEATTPTNYTGGLYASDLFLEYYIPLIEQSPAFKQGGLIDITFDEANPPFTYSGNSFNNAPTSGPGTPSYGKPGTDAPGADSVFGAYGIVSDAAGENIDGKNVAEEPTGPNSTLATNSAGDQLDPGPGFNAFIDRPAPCSATVTTNCVQGEDLGGGSTSPGARTDAVIGTSGSSVIEDPSIQADDTGREVTGTGLPDVSGGLFVGEVADDGPVYLLSNSGKPYDGRFQLVDDQGNPVALTGAVSSITLSAEAPTADLASGVTADPLYDATDPTPGGGDTGSVLISPYIKPGTTSTIDYNHYSWLRTMEDLFDVSSCVGTKANVSVPGGTLCGGLDGQGHLGFAAQAGLAPMGRDVFNDPTGQHPEQRSDVAWWATSAASVTLLGAYVGLRRLLGGSTD